MIKTIIYIIVFLYGLVIGSFLNVCIYRIPEKSGIIFGRSHCMSCNTRIKWYDLIPVFSYINLHGKCRNCNAAISVQYPLIEALNAVLYVLVFYQCGFWTLEQILISSADCLIISALIVLSVIDFRTNLIPVGVNIFIAAAGLVIILVRYLGYGRNTGVILDHMIGALAVSSFLLLIYRASRGRGIGGGDIKLIAAAGFALGWKEILLAFFIGCVLASVIHPVRMKVKNADRKLAFGPYLSAGIAAAILYGDQILSWYLQTFIHSV